MKHSNIKTSFLLLFALLVSCGLQAQQFRVSGVVSDSSGMTLPGVNILEEGTMNGVITGMDGEYEIVVASPEAVLLFSYMGYETMRIPVNGRALINVEMAGAVTGLDEVVVIGYGSQKRASMVGAISTARIEDMENIAASNLSNTIGGRISGIITKTGEGMPGFDDAMILIRGRSTTNDPSPLVLVDGVESSLNRINPSDIESFSVLKDASATAVYGVRGANGVILITTKRGRRGRPQINVNSQLRMHTVISFPNFLNSYDYARLYNEAIWNGGNPNQYYSDQDLELYRTGASPFTHPDIDWFDMLVRPWYPEHRHDISMSGGGNMVSYFVSAEYLQQEGAHKQWDNMQYKTNNSYDRMNIRGNFDFDVMPGTHIAVNMSGRMETINGPNEGDYFGTDRPGLWDNIMVTRPNALAPHNPDGSFGNSPDTRNVELGYMSLRQGGFRNTRRNRIEGNIRLNQQLSFITEGLSARIMYGLTTDNGYTLSMTEKPASYQFNPIDSSYTVMSRRVLPYYTYSNNYFNEINYFEAALNYERTFANDHDVTGLLLYNINSRTFGSSPPASQLGFAGRITYAYKNKYMAEFNAGYNGSDQFVSGNRFAFLPAGSLGWTISEEDFFDVGFINFLRIRGSYGTVANDRIGQYRYLYESIYNQLYPWDPQQNYNTGYAFGVTPVIRPNIREGTMGNENVTWEIARKQNLGVDLWLFNNTFNMSVDVFYEFRDNILDQRRTIPQALGLAREQLPPVNIGEVENKGFEIEMRTMPSIGEVRLQIAGNFSFARNKRLFFDEITQDLYYMNATGRPIGQFFGYIWTGEFYSFEDLGYVWDDDLGDYYLPDGAEPLVPVPDDGAQPGDLKFLDRNGDGVINAYDVGYVNKSNTPEYIYGLSLGFEYKGFSLNTFWQGAGGFTNSFQNNNYLREFVNGAKVHEIHLGRWAYFPEHGIDTRETATYPRLMIDGSPQTRKSSTFMMFPGDYLRLKNIEVGYVLPKRLSENIGATSIRIYITGTNVLTFSKYDFIDPEAPVGSASFYPQSRFFGGGVSARF